MLVEVGGDGIIGTLDVEHRDYGPRCAGAGGRDPDRDPGGIGVVPNPSG